MWQKMWAKFKSPLFNGYPRSWFDFFIFGRLIMIALDKWVLFKIISMDFILFIFLYLRNTWKTLNHNFCTFDLWMSRGGIDTFALFINYWIKARSLGYLIWDYFKFKKQLTTPGFCNSKHCWKKWTNLPCDYFSERWGQQLGIYSYKIEIYYWLWTFEVVASLWRYFWGMRCLKHATNDDKVSTGWIFVNVKKTQVNL
jgi:hypothetical protein